MARILITSGPTRQYLDPVRYLTNASSGRMGACLAQAALELGHEVVIVTGPVSVSYPSDAIVIPVVTTREMLEAVQEQFASCQGMIGAAAPCDYEPTVVHSQKMSKTGGPIQLELKETPDIVATVAATKHVGQWVVGFALETEDARFRSIVKMEKKHCDLMVSNGPTAIDSQENEVEILHHTGRILESIQGDKMLVARGILKWIQQELIPRKSSND